jgi:hypothetical protein
MARGWESKSVEGQIESKESGRQHSGGVKMTFEQIELLRKRETLLLSRTRVLHDLQKSVNPRYQKMLSDALAFLDRELADLN